VINHVIHAQIHQINHVLAVLLMVYILITMKNYKHVRYSVKMVIIKVTIIVCHAINLA